MSVLYCNHQETGLVAGRKGTRTYERTFMAVTDNAADTADTVANGSGVPRKTGQYRGAVCISVDYEQQRKAPHVWRIIARYERPAREGEEPEGADPVEGARPEIWFTFEPFMRQVTKDIDGKIICNSAGQPVLPKPEIEDGILVAHISLREWTYNPLRAFDWEYLLNKEPFWGMKARYWLLRPVTGRWEVDRSERGQWSYWRVKYELALHPQGWELDLLDEGMYVRDTAGDPASFAYQFATADSLKKITDKHGVPVERMVNLNGGGEPLEDGRPPVYRKWRVRGEANFQNLNLPDIGKLDQLANRSS